MRRGFKCRKEIAKILKEKYNNIVEQEYQQNFVELLKNFDSVAENKLRTILNQFYEKPKSKNQAWKSCKGELYEYAVFKAIEQIISHEETLRRRFRVIMGDNALLHYKDKIVIKNWNDILPDVDMLILEEIEQSGEVIETVRVIISCKTSLRERLTETAFWKRELEKDSRTQNIKLIFITTDKDNELKGETNRYILLHVIDCTFVTDPSQYEKLIRTYQQKYGNHPDFNELLSKVRDFSKIGDYFRTL